MGFRDRGNAHKWSPSGSAAASGAAGGNGGVFAGERAAWRRGPGGNTSSGVGMGMDVDTSPRVLAQLAPVPAYQRERRWETIGTTLQTSCSFTDELGLESRHYTYQRWLRRLRRRSCFSSRQWRYTQTSRPNSPLMMPISSPSGSVLYRAGFHHPCVSSLRKCK